MLKCDEILKFIIFLANNFLIIFKNSPQIDYFFMLNNIIFKNNLKIIRNLKNHEI
jgi:hypothetical protein